MASNSFEFQADGALQGKIDWSSISNGSSANSSNVTAIIYARKINSTVPTQGQSWSGYVKINSAQTNISFLSSVSVGSNWVEMARVTTTVAHNNDGTGSADISGSVTGPSGTTLANKTSSGSSTVVLDRIPRASTVTCPDGNIGSSTIININRASNNFTHTLKYTFGNLNGTIVSNTNQTSYGWIIPTTFYTQIPNNNSGQGTIICETYEGNTLIGTNTCIFNAFVVNSNPIISTIIEDVNVDTIALTGDSNKLVKYFSNAQVSITATAQNSSTIVEQKVICEDGKSSTLAISTLEGVESGNFIVSCTDSRNLTTNQTIVKTLIEYVKLVMTEVTLKRLSTTSDEITAIVKGNYFNGSFGTSNNSLSLKWRYKQNGGTWSNYTTVIPTITNNTFSYTASLGNTYNYRYGYEFEFVATDALDESTETKIVTPGIPIVDIGENDVIVNGEIKKDGTNLFELIYPIGSIYMSVNSTNPSTLFGGTWTAWGTGRVPVGIDVNDTDFDTAEKTGGEKTHTLILAEMPSHNHNITSARQYDTGTATDYSTKLGRTTPSADGVEDFASQNIGGGQAHNNMQPFIVCYMWKRIA